MYNFNEIEKHVIRQIISLKGNKSGLANFIIGKVNRALIEVCPEQNTATMILHYYMGSAIDNMEEKYDKIYYQNIELLCTTINLLHYLKMQNLVYDYCVLPKDESLKKFHLGFHPNPQVGGVNMKIEDHDLVENIIKLSHRVFLPTTDLIEIVNNNFQTFDEVKFKKQLIATWVSIVIAFFFGVYGIFK